MINILIVDDHLSILEGTKMLLEQESDFNISIENSSLNALNKIKLQHFDILLFDLYMPHLNGLELTRKALAYNQDLIVLIYTGFDIKPHFNLLVEAGVSGFLSKTSSREELVIGIRSALRQQVVLPLSLVRELRRPGIVSAGTNSQETVILTKTEEDILAELSKGKSTREIANSLSMSQRSLEYNLTLLYQKFGVRTRVDTIAKAKKLGLIPEEEL
ncbi:response regulator transcription factor [Bacillus methanolicus]|uniref:LuxR family two component transcriptional regulator n=1 Tax=Bacillus methanolicus (strain MGA3 / ATCC 53907) TaxID=796606 RepID=I3E973_BACMM|nr:response regulator transcription factor [Bacillus methanolicus]AIE60299.1 LuxR family two component transcriptional regulator [Bacillus methanolicus MGA3]EIJ83044.1 two-component response regulator [Bacillus methanolicus MGA3]